MVIWCGRGVKFHWNCHTSVNLVWEGCIFHKKVSVSCGSGDSGCRGVQARASFFVTFNFDCIFTGDNAVDGALTATRLDPGRGQGGSLLPPLEPFSEDHC